jgi:hypothetical protein
MNVSSKNLIDGILGAGNRNEIFYTLIFISKRVCFMKKVIWIGIFLLTVTTSAHAYLWTSAVPTEIHIVPDGLVLLGDFENTGVICATGPKAIFLPKIDPAYKEKLSLAMTAIATGKKIRVLISDPIEFNCIEIAAMGHIPVANHYFWQLKD